MNPWFVAILAYTGLGVLTFVPILRAIFGKVEMHDGGSSFDDATVFSEGARGRLSQHFSRIQGTLGFWKKQATIYKRLHYYTLCWTIPSSVVIPFLAQAMTDDPYSKWLITVVSAHTAILLAFHKALKVDSNYKAFRHGESEFYDLYRRMLDRPNTLGATETEQLECYFDSIENVRKFIRNAETDNLPTIEQAKSQLADEVPKIDNQP